MIAYLALVRRFEALEISSSNAKPSPLTTALSCATCILPHSETAATNSFSRPCFSMQKMGTGRTDIWKDYTGPIASKQMVPESCICDHGIFCTCGRASLSHQCLRVEQDEELRIPLVAAQKPHPLLLSM